MPCSSYLDTKKVRAYLRSVIVVQMRNVLQGNPASGRINLRNTYYPHLPIL